MTYKLNTRKTFLETKGDLEREFRLWKVEEWRLSRDNAGAVVEWLPAGAGSQYRRLESADQDTLQANARKLFLIVEALRLNEERGLAGMMRDYYLQLPAGVSGRDPYEVLGVRSDTPLEEIEAVYKVKANRYHPDRPGGDAGAMARLNEAMERIRAEKAEAVA